jgi:hypothetical protein
LCYLSVSFQFPFNFVSVSISISNFGFIVVVRAPLRLPNSYETEDAIKPLQLRFSSVSFAELLVCENQKLTVDGNRR